MKKLLLCTVGLCALLMAADFCFAQPPGGGGRGGAGRGGAGRGPFGPQVHPLVALLDEDKDGAISLAELEKAVEKLKKFDKNGDGKITANELPAPPRSQQMRGQQMRAQQMRGGRLGGQAGPGGPGGQRGGGPNAGPGRSAPGGGNFIERIKRLDANGDGAISKDEAPEQMQPMFSRLDADGNGVIDKAELEAAAQRMSGRGGPGGPGGPGGAGGGGDFMERLLGFDKDDDGKVSKEEAPERMQRMFDRIDANGDGLLDKEELKVMAERFRGARGGNAGGPPAKN